MTSSEARDWLESLDCIDLTPEQAAKALNCNPHAIRLQAHDAPEKLGYRVSVTNRTVRIPRRPFIEFWWGSAGMVGASGVGADGVLGKVGTR